MSVCPSQKFVFFLSVCVRNDVIVRQYILTNSVTDELSCYPGSRASDGDADVLPDIATQLDGDKESTRKREVQMAVQTAKTVVFLSSLTLSSLLWLPMSLIAIVVAVTCFCYCSFVLFVDLLVAVDFRWVVIVVVGVGAVKSDGD